MFPKIRGKPQNVWFIIMENPILKMDDLGKTHYFWKYPFIRIPGSNNHYIPSLIPTCFHNLGRRVKTPNKALKEGRLSLACYVVGSKKDGDDFRVGGWTNPFEKYESKWVHLPQCSGWKKNPPALPACLVKWGLMTDCLSVLCFCLYSLS